MQLNELVICYCQTNFLCYGALVWQKSVLMAVRSCFAKSFFVLDSLASFKKSSKDPFLHAVRVPNGLERNLARTYKVVGVLCICTNATLSHFTQNS